MRYTTEQLLKAGVECSKVHELERKARRARDGFTKKYTERGFWSSTEIRCDGIIMQLALAVYLDSYPEAKPKICAWTSQGDGAEWACMEYPPEFVGWIRPGFAFWVKASTKSIITKAAPEVTPAETRLAADTDKALALIAA